jgi:hypothetical protein
MIRLVKTYLYERYAIAVSGFFFACSPATYRLGFQSIPIAFLPGLTLVQHYITP